MNPIRRLLGIRAAHFSHGLFTQEIAYDTHDNLVAMGVIPAWRFGERRPRPFPSSPDGAGFVPDPPDDP